MATKRARSNGKFQYVVKRKKLLPKPLTFTFENEIEGDAYIAELEDLLDKGVVPLEILNAGMTIKLHTLIRDYIKSVQITDDDRRILESHKKRIANIDVAKITYKWTETWVRDLKQTRKLAPGTITKHVGTLARCLDWGVRSDYLPTNPLRMLPKGYATYNDADVRQAGVKRVDIERDRRLEAGEEARILKVIRGDYEPGNKQRKLVLDNLTAYKMLFLLSLETAMRMRELYTLSTTQVDLENRTIFLDKIKNGDKRQVPLSGPAISILKNAASMKNKEAFLFPWFNGKHNREALNKTTILLSRQWKRIFEHAECVGLNFHDLRHEATSRIYERTSLSDLEIAKITGHKNLKMLQRYANLRGSDLADKLW
tara:strand:- start:240 stop:1349 length:1110 start_codon:yes stop_codon:yes gene_type:complete